MPKKRKPHGRDEVMASVLEAASELFANKGVAGVSVRDIAAKAGVNHGLIHRHFGSKEVLRRQTQEKLSADLIGEMGPGSSFEETMSMAWAALLKHDAYWRVLARTLLDGKWQGEIQSDFPFVDLAVQMAKKEQEQGRVIEDADPKMIVAGIMAMALGLEVFQDYILTAAKLKDGDPLATKANILNFWRDLVKLEEEPPE
ncbi:TetR/AcrR family transcriptional regulator [Desulfatibacillum aliphaticivorans]|uniref:TetR/AcrR family transcriptional regulator n=1 Tax=Desulfatibacillum aliphaticivorans TaxID=218208 RepID=UPI0003FD6647|nr:TetR/AcrR family transcriptional regulator [Desulfatibacillum aliphaticivorans]